MFGEKVGNKENNRYLDKKESTINTVCTNCSNKIQPGSIYYLEKGKREHIHSLIARKFCSECYSRYGERKLIKGKE